MPAGVTLLTPPDAVIASVAPPRLAAEELAEAEAAPVAEAAPAAAPAAEAPAETEAGS